MVLTKTKHFIAKAKEIYIGKVEYKGRRFNVTYDPNSQNVIINEWYTLNNKEIEEMSKFVKDEFAAIAAR